MSLIKFPPLLPHKKKPLYRIFLSFSQRKQGIMGGSRPAERERMKRRKTEGGFWEPEKAIPEWRRGGPDTERKKGRRIHEAKREIKEEKKEKRKKILRLKKNLKRITSFPYSSSPAPKKKPPPPPLKKIGLPPLPSSCPLSPRNFHPPFVKFQFSALHFSPKKNPLSFSFPSDFLFLRGREKEGCGWNFFWEGGAGRGFFLWGEEQGGPFFSGAEPGEERSQRGKGGKGGAEAPDFFPHEPEAFFQEVPLRFLGGEEV